MKGIKNECRLIERCDGHGGGVRGWRGVMVMMEVQGGVGRCDSCQEGGSPKEVCQLVERCDGHGKK